MPERQAGDDEGVVRAKMEYDRLEVVVADLWQTQDSHGTVILCSSGYFRSSATTHEEWHESHPDAARETLERATALATMTCGEAHPQTDVYHGPGKQHPATMSSAEQAGDQGGEVDTDKRTPDLIDRQMGRARVTMTWEVDAEYGASEGGGIRCEGWIVDAETLLAQCSPDNAHKTTIERLS